MVMNKDNLTDEMCEKYSVKCADIVRDVCHWADDNDIERIDAVKIVSAMIGEVIKDIDEDVINML